MGLVRNDWKDRQRIRAQMQVDMISDPTITPVLLLYWTCENLETYLIPATPEELEKLKKVNGIDNQGTGWETVEDELEYIQEKRYRFDELRSTVHGEWQDRYLVDTHDENEQPLPPVILPPGTVVIITGFIL